MDWFVIAYMVAGVPLTLLVLWLEKEDLDSFDIRLAVFAGPFVGGVVFIFVMLFLFNWGRAIRLAWCWTADRLAPPSTPKQGEGGNVR